MSSALHDSPALQNDNLIAISNGAEAMRDDETRTSAAAKTVVDHLLGSRVKGTGCFVEDQDAGFAGVGPARFPAAVFVPR